MNNATNLTVGKAKLFVKEKRLIRQLFIEYLNFPLPNCNNSQFSGSNPMQPLV